jgi:hypothetical protein
MAANAAPANPAAPHVSFSASNDGASAGWSNGKGTAIDLTLGSIPASTYAEITLHGVAGTTVSNTSEPTLATTNYNAGSPRWYVTLNDGNFLVGYPSNLGQSTAPHMAWTIGYANNTEPWSAIQTSAEGSATVTGAYVIADGDQTPGTTDVITGLTFNHTSFN